MLMVPPAVRIYVCAVPADMRRSFDGLAAMTEQIVKQDPLSGHLFVFCNKAADRVKVLWWDRSGLCLWYKRLELGAFRFPRHDEAAYEVEAAELALILEGIELSGAKRRPRFTPRVIQKP